MSDDKLDNISNRINFLSDILKIQSEKISMLAHVIKNRGKEMEELHHSVGKIASLISEGFQVLAKLDEENHSNEANNRSGEV